MLEMDVLIIGSGLVVFFVVYELCCYNRVVMVMKGKFDCNNLVFV